MKTTKNKEVSFWTLTKGVRLFAAITIIIGIIEVISQVAMPGLAGQIIDEIRKPSDQIVMKHIWKNAILLIVFAFGALTTGILSSFMSAKASSRYAQNIRNHIFAKVQIFSFNDIDYFSSGAILNRLNNDVNNIQMSFNLLIRTLIRLPIMFVVALVFSIHESVELSGIFLVTIPFIAISTLFIWKTTNPKFKRLYRQYDKYNQKVQENLYGIRTIKSYVTEEFEFKRMKEITNKLRDTNTEAEKNITWSTLVIMGAIFMSVIALAVIGTNLYLSKKIQIGSIIAFSSYIWMVSGSLMGLMNVMGFVLMAIPTKKRIDEIIKRDPSIKNNENALVVDLDGSIEFKNVNFSYHNTTAKALNDINIDILPSETIGIIGETGSGKTTFINLINRFYDPDNGTVLFNDIDLKDLDIQNTTSQIATVFQDNILFSGTIRSNMKFGKPDATDEEIYQALKYANIYDYVINLPEKLDSVVTQKGSNFSGGQRQRLCIARALIKQPKILILDDATSAVDFKTEAEIKQALNKINSCTKIIIAQKVSSIKNCDRIVIFKDGKIEQIGTHSQLFETNEFYKELYEIQQNAGGLDENTID
ncbi:ABC transporter ATP-binding protein [Mycoplasma sp. Pen4]|uniref:ABC transporter ATP-binding protein n=1 Tax=Mycoplasma sp. Pen4 TaxID=640330 RepID=UPI001654B7E8|nr:ABC transporter ATP-binding protein [Mycoplasma sp. Pen4]QNM93880.1 ABC transporter ATP-binding protein [Mycoplasma sp. Pen4]